MSQNNLSDNRYMEFRLGNQLYAIPLLSVKEVIPRPDTTPVPNMPSSFEGMINLRGQILGVYNVRKKLGAKAHDANSALSEVIIIIEHLGLYVGVIVDEVTRVLHAESDKIGPAPLKDDDPAKNFIGSVIQTAQDLVMTVHIPELLELDKHSHLKAA